MDERKIYRVDYVLKIGNQRHDRTCYVKAYDDTNAFRVAGFYIHATTGIMPEIDIMTGISEILIIDDNKMCDENK